MKDKNYFSEVSLCRFILALSPSQVIKAVFLLVVQEKGKGTSSQREFILCL